MQTLPFLFIAFSTYLYHPALKTKSVEAHQTDTLLTALKKNKRDAELYEYHHREVQINLAKVAGKKAPIKIKGEYAPNNAEHVYTVTNNEAGKVISITESPVSESGDWYIGHRYFFDNNGNVYAFTKTETIFDESVKGGIAMRLLTLYYGSNHETLSKSVVLADKNRKPLKNRKSTDFNFHDDQYTVYKNLDECLVAYHIQLDK